MTSYRLFCGYNSTFGRDEVEGELEAFIKALRAEPERIIKEALRLEPALSLDRLADFAESYRENKDLTCFIKRDKEEDGKLYIVQYASGGGEDRDYKEACRRAVARLTIEHMHKNRMEISFSVG
jgi:hypothetical protein